MKNGRFYMGVLPAQNQDGLYLVKNFQDMLHVFNSEWDVNALVYLIGENFQVTL